MRDKDRMAGGMRIPHELWHLLEKEAVRRRVSWRTLVFSLLTAIVVDDLYAAVLDADDDREGSL